MPEGVGDLPGRQAGVVESGRDRLAEHVRGDPRKSGAVEGRTQVTAGVVRIAQSAQEAGKDDQPVRAVQLGRRPPQGSLMLQQLLRRRSCRSSADWSLLPPPRSPLAGDPRRSAIFSQRCRTPRVELPGELSDRRLGLARDGEAVTTELHRERLGHTMHILPARPKPHREGINRTGAVSSGHRRSAAPPMRQARLLPRANLRRKLLAPSHVSERGYRP